MRTDVISRRQVLKGSVATAVLLTAPNLTRAQSALKVLRIRTEGDLQVLDPAHRLSMPEDDIMGAIFNKLVRYEPGVWEAGNEIAEGIEQISPTETAFTLRPGVMWSDGFGEVTAEDVKFSFERIADPETGSGYLVDWEALDHVEVTGKYTGIIRTKTPFAPLWRTSLPTGSGCIVCKKAVEAANGKIGTDPLATSGPYIIKEWIPKQKTILVRNENWNGPKPAYDEIHLFPIEDPKQAELAFEAGELDHTAISMSSISNYREDLPPGAKLIERNATAYVWLGINTENKPFDDQRVRRAVQRAVDVNAVLEAAYFGVAERSTGVIAPGIIGHREKNLTPSEPDYDEARRLLSEAGFPDGLDCTLDILNTAEFSTAAEIIQASLANAGIRVKINLHDSGTWWTLGAEEAGGSYKDIQLILNKFYMAPDPSWGTAWFVPEQIGIWNWERWNNPEFGELHKKALAELDESKRAAMYVRMQDLMEESGAYLFITHGVNAFLHRDTVLPAISADGQNAYFRLFEQA